MSTGKAGRPLGATNKPGHAAGGFRSGAGRKPKVTANNTATESASGQNLGPTGQAPVSDIPGE